MALCKSTELTMSQGQSLTCKKEAHALFVADCKKIRAVTGSFVF